MSNAIAGTVTLMGPTGKVSVKGSVTCSFWDSENESISGQDGIHGYKKTYVSELWNDPYVLVCKRVVWHGWLG